MPALSTKRWTAAEVRELMERDPLYTRYELLDGELIVTPSPVQPHQRAVLELVHCLDPYLEKHRTGEVLCSPADIVLAPETIMQPDVFVIGQHDADGNDWASIHSLTLAAEVLSPRSRRYDRVKKRLHYLKSGVAEYWVVDCETRSFERWTPEETEAEILDREIVWHPAGAAAPLCMDIVLFFDNVFRAHGEPRARAPRR